jgi:hypothetical protein
MLSCLLLAFYLCNPNAPVAYAPQPTYYPVQQPQVVYAQPPQAYYPAPVYYVPQPVVASPVVAVRLIGWGRHGR